TSAAISPVCTSDEPCGAATTRPGRPGRAAMWPRGVCGGNSTAWVAQPNRTSGPAATLTSRRSPVRVIVHEHRLRERVVAVVGQGQQHVTAAAGQTQLARAAVEHQARRLAALAADLEIAPAHAEAQPAAERLRGRLLGREARGEVGHGIAPRAAVGDLALREDAAQEALVPARDDVAHARDPDDVHAPIWVRMTPASSSAIAWMRAASAPSIISRASASVPEQRISTRPLPFISVSNAPTRSPRPGMESMGGLLRTGTLTSTWGNL